MTKSKVETWVLQDGRAFEVHARFYLASCDKCHWVGSSEHCGTDYGGGDDTDVYCPSCGASGADCGREALLAVQKDAPNPSPAPANQGT